MLSASTKGWQADGIEISEEALTLAEAKGQHVFKGDIAALDLGKDKYDIAALFRA